MSQPTAEEQLYLELINETRLDPLASAARYISAYAPLTASDAEIQSALTFFRVDGAALQAAFAALPPVGPLAWNDALGSAAEKHSATMIAADEQSHQLPGEASLGARISAEGYAWSTAGENIYAYSESTLYGHAGFMVDWGNGPGGMQSPAGHRDNIMRANFREVGIDVTSELNSVTAVGPQVVTQDFAARTGKYFVLGVAYSDADANRFYSVGEGRGDLTVRVGGRETTSAASGGYSLEVGLGTTIVTLSGGGLATPVTLATVIGSENLKLDVVDGGMLLSSGSLTLTGGAISVLRGLGVRGLSLAAGAGDQTIEGTSGDDTLSGGAGNDTLSGGAGNDVAVFSGNNSDYSISAEAGGYRLIDQRSGGGDGSDLVLGVEQVQFADRVRSAASLLKLPEPPVATADVAQTTTGAPVAIAVLANDSDGDGDLLSIAAVAAPGHGTASANGDGTITYTPATGFTGQDSFTYTVSDGNGGNDTAVVTVEVAAAAHVGRLASDYDGDGRDDILWRSDGGAVSNWLGRADGGFIGNDAHAFTQVATEWKIVGTGDFDGDGRFDVLWRNTATGDLSDWLGQANGGFAGNDPNAMVRVTTDWHVVGTGDFNGDGRDDILWRSDGGALSDWLGQPNGGFIGNDGNAFAQVAIEWKVVGTGDFNGDGRDDVLWRNAATGALSDWLGQANGGFIGNDGNAFAQVATEWKVVGTGDFNGDGRDDVLWRNTATGGLSDWLGQPNGGFAGNDANAFSQVPLEWQVAGTGDYNGDGRSDILWRNIANGALSDWLGQANGGFVGNDANAFVNGVPMNWHVQAFDSFFP